MNFFKFNLNMGNWANNPVIEPITETTTAPQEPVEVDLTEAILSGQLADLGRQVQQNLVAEPQPEPAAEPADEELPAIGTPTFVFQMNGGYRNADRNRFGGVRGALLIQGEYGLMLKFPVLSYRGQKLATRETALYWAYVQWPALLANLWAACEAQADALETQVETLKPGQAYKRDWRREDLQVHVYGDPRLVVRSGRGAGEDLSPRIFEGKHGISVDVNLLQETRPGNGDDVTAPTFRIVRRGEPGWVDLTDFAFGGEEILPATDFIPDESNKAPVRTLPYHEILRLKREVAALKDTQGQGNTQPEDSAATDAPF
jgi:hypothetical protein